MNPKVSKYPWPYLMKNEVRSKVLFEALKPHLHDGEQVLDVGCGYSPLAEPLLANEHSIFGFDPNVGCINYLRKNFPQGGWVRSGFRDMPTKFCTVLLLLGISGNPVAIENFLHRALSVYPDIVFLDTAICSRKDVTLRDGIPFHNKEERWRKLHNRVVEILLERRYEMKKCGYYANPVETTWREDDVNRSWMVMKRKVISKADEYDALRDNPEAYRKGIYDRRGRYLLNMLIEGGEPPRRIIELACSYGWLGKLILDNTSVERYLCTNFSQPVIEYTERQNIEGMEVRKMDAYEVINRPQEFSEFDTFICTSLEHLERDRELVEAIPSGRRFLFGVPNFGSPSHFRYFRRRQDVIDRYKDLLTFEELGVIAKDKGYTKFIANTVRR